MYVVEKYTPLISKRQQTILLLLYDNNNRIRFKEQNIFKNRRYFNKAMNQLYKANVLIKNVVIENNHYCTEYFLNHNGVFLVEKVIKDFILCNKRNG